MGLDGRDTAGRDRKEIERTVGMGMEGMDEKRWEVKGQDEMVQDGKGRELKGSSGITHHLDNKTQILDIALFCINQFIHNIPANQIFSR